MIPEVIVARHAGIPLAAIGVVKSCVIEGELISHCGAMRGRNLRSLASLIVSLLERL
jgi:purine nucleoside phosphorylase